MAVDVERITIVVVVVVGVGISFAHRSIELRDDTGEHAEAGLLLWGGRSVGDHDDDRGGSAVELRHDDDRALTALLHGDVVGREEQGVAQGFSAELIVGQVGPAAAKGAGIVKGISLHGGSIGALPCGRCLRSTGTSC